MVGLGNLLNRSCCPLVRLPVSETTCAGTSHAKVALSNLHVCVLCGSNTQQSYPTSSTASEIKRHNWIYFINSSLTCKAIPAGDICAYIVLNDHNEPAVISGRTFVDITYKVKTVKSLNLLLLLFFLYA